MERKTYHATNGKYNIVDFDKSGFHLKVKGRIIFAVTHLTIISPIRRQLISYYQCLPGAGVDPGRGLTPANFRHPAPGRGLTPAKIFCP